MARSDVVKSRRRWERRREKMVRREKSTINLKSVSEEDPLTRERAKPFHEVEAREKWLGQTWSKVDVAGSADEKKWSEEKNLT
jgi:hypothetical protein